MNVLIAIIIIGYVGEGFTLSDNSTFDRVYKGFKATEKQFPFMVFLMSGIFRREGNKFATCSGSLIKLNTIMTAAHCFQVGPSRAVMYRPEDNVVAVGITDYNDYVDFRLRNDFKVKYTKYPNLQEALPNRLYIHPRFALYYNYDIAIVKLAKDFKKTDYVSTVPYTTDEYPGKIPCLLIGFGETEMGEDKILMYFITASIKKNSKLCGSGDDEPELYCYDKDHISKSSICLGDSGGPLFCDNKVYGVNIRIDDFINTTVAPPCGSPGIIEIFKLAIADGKKFLGKHEKQFRSISKSCNVAPQFSVFIIFILLVL